MNYFVVKDEIKDVHGGDMGYFFSLYQKDNIDTSKSVKWKLTFYL